MIKENSHKHLGVVFLHGPFVFHFSGPCSLKPELLFLLSLGVDPAKNLRRTYVCVEAEGHTKGEAVLNETSLLLRQIKAELLALMSRWLI